jgi:multiple sugar transport system ATP-binding protein
VREAAELLGITACLSRRPRDLSRGEQQRVALGRALVRRPALFLLDEPLAHLDALTRRDLRAQIAGLPGMLGVPMILVTHDQSEAMTLGHRLAILRDGALQQVGRPLEIYRKPANVFVAGFLGSPPMNLLPGKLAEETGALVWRRRSQGAGELRLTVPCEKLAVWRSRVGREILAGLRPEQVRVVVGEASSADGSIRAIVREVELHGAETLVRVAVAGLELTARAPATFEGVAGGHVDLRIDPQAARFFDPASGRALG